MDMETNESISLLDEAKIQARVLVPVIRAFRKELGDEHANRIMRAALREWSHNVLQQVAAHTQGTPRQKWEALTAANMPRIGDAIDIEMLKHEPDTMEFNITGCRYADFFRQLDEPELGALLLCESDDRLAEIGSPEVEFTRTQTIMQGARYCDFRYRMKKIAGSADR